MKPPIEIAGTFENAPAQICLNRDHIVVNAGNSIYKLPYAKARRCVEKSDGIRIDSDELSPIFLPISDDSAQNELLWQAFLFIRRRDSIYLQVEQRLNTPGISALRQRYLQFRAEYVFRVWRSPWLLLLPMLIIPLYFAFSELYYYHCVYDTNDLVRIQGYIRNQVHDNRQNRTGRYRQYTV